MGAGICLLKTLFCPCILLYQAFWCAVPRKCAETSLRGENERPRAILACRVERHTAWLCIHRRIALYACHCHIHFKLPTQLCPAPSIPHWPKKLLALYLSQDLRSGLPRSVCEQSRPWPVLRSLRVLRLDVQGQEISCKQRLNWGRGGQDPGPGCRAD